MSEKTLSPKDYTLPTRMSWEALVIGTLENLWKLIKGFFPIVLVALFTPGKTQWITLGIFGLLMIWAIITQVYSYFHTTFHIEGDKLLYHSSFLVRTTDRTIPLDRVHAYRTKSNFIYQMVDVVGVVFETLADDKEEVELILSENDLKAFMAQVNSRYQGMEPITDEDIQTPVEGDECKTTIKYSVGQLMQGALVQNHLKGLAIFGYVIWLVYSEISDVFGDRIEEIADYTTQQLQVMTWSSIFIILIIAYLLSALLFIIVSLSRYYGLTLVLGKDEISYTAGLFNRVTNRFSRDKVFGLSLKQNILERWTGRTTVRLEQAANVQGKKQKHEIVLIGTKDYAPLLDWWLGTDLRDESVRCYGHSGPAIGYVLFMQKWAWVCIPLIVLAFFYPIYSLPFLLIVVALGVWDARIYTRRSDIAAREDMIVLHGGGLSHRTTNIMYEGIEQVRLTRSPFAFKSHRTGLVISTNGGSYRVRSLSESDAYMLFNYLLYRIER